MHVLDPTLFPTLSGSILDLLASCSSLALCSIEDGSPQSDALRAITTFATETAMSDPSKCVLNVVSTYQWICSY